MKLVNAALAATSLALLAQPVMAQQPDAPAAQDMAPVSDSELENFIIAASMLGQVQKDANLEAAEKEEASMQILAKAELTPQRFNSIGAALQNDEKLQARASATVTRLQEEQAQG